MKSSTTLRRSRINRFTRICSAAFLALAFVTGANRAHGQVDDHLICYKAKDPLALKGVVNLASPQFGPLAGCSVGKAKVFCVYATKAVVEASDKNTPIDLLPVDGAQQTDDRICYKLKCDSAEAMQLVSDQFGSRTITRGKTAFLCTPAIKGPPPSTTTTTTPGGCTPAQCQDGNPCTQDVCNNQNQCVHPPATDGTACDDGSACTLVDTCSSGICGGAFNCDDGIACTVDSCAGGTCTHGGDNSICADASACTVNTCDAVFGCQTTNAADGTTCDDDNNGVSGVCQNGVCQEGGACTPAQCEDGNPCTQDACNGQGQCVHPPAADGVPCDDHNACSPVDTCSSGICVGAVNCDDGITCTVDSCAGGTCAHAAHDAICADASACTVNTCNAVLGCQTTNAGDGTPCDDNNNGLSGVCHNGLCQGD